MKTKKDKRTMLEKEIDRLCEELNRSAPDSTRYTELEENLQALAEVKRTLKEAETDDKAWIDILKPVIGGLFGVGQILVILNYEKLGVISSKALGFVLRGRA